MGYSTPGWQQFCRSSRSALSSDPIATLVPSLNTFLPLPHIVLSTPAKSTYVLSLEANVGLYTACISGEFVGIESEDTCGTWDCYDFGGDDDSCRKLDVTKGLGGVSVLFGFTALVLHSVYVCCAPSRGLGIAACIIDASTLSLIAGSLGAWKSFIAAVEGSSVTGTILHYIADSSAGYSFILTGVAAGITLLALAFVASSIRLIVPLGVTAGNFLVLNDTGSSQSTSVTHTSSSMMAAGAAQQQQSQPQIHPNGQPGAWNLGGQPGAWNPSGPPGAGNPSGPLGAGNPSGQPGAWSPSGQPGTWSPNDAPQFIQGQTGAWNPNSAQQSNQSQANARWPSGSQYAQHYENGQSGAAWNPSGGPPWQMSSNQQQPGQYTQWTQRGQAQPSAADGSYSTEQTNPVYIGESQA